MEPTPNVPERRQKMNQYRRDFPIIQNRKITYLDSGATTQKPIQVIKAVEEI